MRLCVSGSSSTISSRCGSSFGRFGFRWVFAGVQRLQEAEEAGSFTDAAKLDAEGLDLDEQVLDVDDLVSDQRLEENADQSDQPVLERTDLVNIGIQGIVSTLQLNICVFS